MLCFSLGLVVAEEFLREERICRSWVLKAA